MPSAPFIGTSERFTELGIKRLLKYAKEWHAKYDKQYYKDNRARILAKNCRWLLKTGRVTK